MTRIAASLAVAIVLGGLYLWRLGDAPLGIDRDEAWFAIHGASLAASGRDLNGVTWPLLVQLDPELGTDVWFQPALFYMVAASFTVFPVSEWAARLPVAIVGLLCVWLAYAIAKQIHGRRSWAAAAAAMMALTPSLLVFSRQAVDYLCPVPFVMGWLWMVLQFAESPRRRFAVGAGVLLGLGLFTYLAAWMLMPVFFVLTLITAVFTRRPSLAAGCAAGFLPWLGLLIAWLWWHPGVLPDLLRRYDVDDTSAWLQGFLHYYRLVDMVRDYWASFNPANLFLIASGNPMQGTHLAGMFTAPLMILLPAGAVVLARRADRSLLLVAGFLLAPLAAVVNRSPGVVERELLLLPFGALIASVGLRAMIEGRGRWIRGLAIALAAAIPIHFAIFAADYFTTHNRVAFGRRDPLNLHQLSLSVAELDAARHAPAILLGFNPGVDKPTWVFHMEKPANASLRSRWRYVSEQELPGSAPADSLIVINDATVAADRAEAVRRDSSQVGVVRNANSTLSIWRRR